MIPNPSFKIVLFLKHLSGHIENIPLSAVARSVLLGLPVTDLETLLHFTVQYCWWSKSGLCLQEMAAYKAGGGAKKGGGKAAPAKKPAKQAAAAAEESEEEDDDEEDEEEEEESD